MVVPPIRRRLVPFVAAFAMLLGLPGAAHAAMITFGSDLSAPANLIEAHGADSAFWNVQLAGGGITAAPAGGQVTVVKVKGTVIPDPTGRRNPITMFHFQTIRPMPDGSVSVWLSSGPMYTPIGGNPETISSYRPVNMCMHKGDYLDFNDWGGNEWWWGSFSGIPWRTFSRVQGSAVNFYTKNAGTNNGSRWKPMETKQSEELLMQMRLATGPDATDICPGGYKQHVYRGIKLHGQSTTLRTQSRTAEVRFTCPGPSYGYCKGTARAVGTLNGQQVTLGQGSFKAQRSYSGTVRVSFPAPHVTAIQKAKGLTVRLIVDSHDDPQADWHARSNDVPVQSRTQTAALTLKPDRPFKRKRR